MRRCALMMRKGCSGSFRRNITIITILEENDKKSGNISNDDMLPLLRFPK